MYSRFRDASGAIHMDDTYDTTRRSVLATGVALAGVGLAGCSGGGGGGGSKFDGTVEQGELYDPFEAEEGDTLDVTIEAGDDGASVGVTPTEGEASFGDDVGWGWTLDPGEEVEDEIEIDADDDYSVWASEGSADVTVE